MTILLPVKQIRPGDQIWFASYDRWFAVEEIRQLAFKFVTVTEYPFTRWPVLITKEAYLVKRCP